PAFWGPPAILAAATVLLGVAPAAADGIVDAALAALVPAAGHVHLALWHGFTLPLGLSVVVFAAGAAMFVARRPVAALLARGRAIPNGSDAYLAALRGLNLAADRITRVVQNGSLPFYAGVILFTAAVAPAAFLLLEGDLPAWPEMIDSPAHVPVVVALVGGALGAALLPRRLGAALLLSVVGYGMAALFVVEGAPDLALTQVTIETLGTVLFVLVLRRLPRRFSRPTSAGVLPRLVVSAAVGAAVFLFALTAADN